MSLLDSLAQKTYVINLAHRKDRRESAIEQLKNIGHDNYEFFDAYGVDNLPPERYYKDIPNFEMSGWWENKFSHYGVIDRAKQTELDSVLVLEDDVIFHPQFDQIASLAADQLELISPWDWLQFGGNHRYFGGITTPQSPIDGMPYAYPSNGLEQVTPNLARILKMLTAHAYIVKEPVYDFILNHTIDSTLSIDGFYAYEIHSRFRCFCMTPCAAKQLPGVSDIGNCYINYDAYIGD